MRWLCSINGKGLDSRMEKIRNDHDALLTSAIEALRKRKGGR